MKRPVYGYDYKTKKLYKRMVERPPEKKGHHVWVAACDKFGNELFGYCELCGKRRGNDE